MTPTVSSIEMINGMMLSSSIVVMLWILSARQCLARRQDKLLETVDIIVQAIRQSSNQSG
jgi:hypothetical protein